MKIHFLVDIRLEHGTTSEGKLYTIEEAFPTGAVGVEPLWVLCREHGGCTTVIQCNDAGMWERWLVKDGLILRDDPDFRTALEPGELLPHVVVDGTASWCETDRRVLLTDFDPVRTQIDETAVA